MNTVFSKKIIIVFAIGLVLRTYACLNTPIINSDGVLYIQQARAIYYGEWQHINYENVGYISNYPFFVAAAYAVFHNWIIAARVISLIFGFATLILIYAVLKRFFDDTSASLATLIFSVTPVLVSRSGDAIRGPIFWFFLMLGLYFFMAQISSKRHLYVFFASLSFLMATWARIEAILFIIVSPLYILFWENDKRFQNVLFFILPVLISISFAVLFALISHTSVMEIYRTNELLSKFSGIIDRYEEVRVNLSDIANLHSDTILSNFFLKARNLVWLIGLGTLFRYAVAAFFYPFFLVFLIGFWGIRQTIHEDHRVVYFLLLVVSALLLLYLHIIHTWVIQYRFLAVVMLPACIFLGFGLQKILYFFQKKFSLSESVAVIVVFLLILGSGIPKNVIARETDKAIFREIGELIDKREGDYDLIKIAAVPSTVQEWVTFYANLNYQGFFSVRDTGIVGKNYNQFTNYVRENEIRYFLWEENCWPVGGFDFIHADYHRDFTTLGSWSHRDTGRVILFEVIDRGEG